VKKSSESGKDVADPEKESTEPRKDVEETGKDVTELEKASAERGMDFVEPGEDAAEIGKDATELVKENAEAGEDFVEAANEISESGKDIDAEKEGSEPGKDVVEPEKEIAETGKVVEPERESAEPRKDIAEPGTDNRAESEASDDTDDGISRVASSLVKQILTDQNDVLQHELDLIGSGDENALEDLITEDNLSRVASMFVKKVLCKETRTMQELQTKMCTEAGENGPEMNNQMRNYANELFGNQEGDRAVETVLLEGVRAKLEKEVASRPAGSNSRDVPPDVRASIREQLQNVKSQLEVVKSELEQVGVRTKSKDSKDK